MLTFTPLSGGAKSTRSVPLAYLLQIDDVRILLDCGSPDWVPEVQLSDGSQDTPYDWETYCEALRGCAPSVDLVLLSHGDLAHSGLFPYAYSRWNLRAPTYTTLPVQAMARIAATEDVDGVRAEEDVGDEVRQDSSQLLGTSEEANGASESPSKRRKYVATGQEVDEAFDSINTLRYSQPTHLQGKCQGLTITAFNAGHTLGGAIWKIRSPSSGTILYAVDMNHTRERHLDGTVLMRQASGGVGVFEPLVRPDLLITDAERACIIASRRKDRDAALIDTITSTLMDRSSLLMPCDASTRVLELLVLLDQHWSYSRLKFPICLISRTGREMLTFVRSMMEWLGGTISKEDVGEDTSGSKTHRKGRHDDGDEDALGAFALRFKHLEFFPTPQALLETYSSKDPKLIIAVPASLSHGPSRQLFSDFASIPRNVVLLTGRSEEGTLGRFLFDKWNGEQREEDKWSNGKVGRNVMMDGSMILRMNSKVPLHGAELEAYLQKERAAKEKEAAHQASLARAQLMLEADEDESDSESDSDEDEDEDDVERALTTDQTDPSPDAPEGTDLIAEPGGARRARKVEPTDWGLDADEGLTKQLLSYDIYLKGNVARTTSFFKSTMGGQTQRFRMFPYVERKRRVDDYGETIDVGTWLRKGKVLEEDAESEDSRETKRRKLAEEEAKKASPEPPSKFVSSNVEIQLSCRLLFVDLEGLNDGRAVKSIVPQVNPRKMIIVHADQNATETLIKSCASIRAMTKDVHAPDIGETIQLGQHTNSFSISLSDELLASVKLSQFEDNEVGFVTGRISSSASSTIPVLEPVTGPAFSSIDPQYNENPSLSAGVVARKRILGVRSTSMLPHSTMIGELKLTALKSRLTAVGVQAELIGEGVLICGGGGGGRKIEDLEDAVAVRKVARGQVVLEGAVSEVYYIVRREVYNLHALVAA